MELNRRKVKIMRITVINGTMRHGSTWNCANQIISEIEKTQAVDLTEFFLPNDMPHFCNGCFSCFYNGETTCPHAEHVNPIVESILKADLLVLTSPVYGMDVSGQMKALLDHLCYMWMSHRPQPEMFQKVGLTVSTTAGAGLGHTTKTMRNSMKFWGMKKLYSFKFPVSAMKWSDVTEKKQAKINRKAKRLAANIAKAINNSQKLPNPLFRSFFFKMMSGMQKKNDWNPTDRKHWQDNGWLTGAKPF
jgi:multimeric flavodoxin WrbA